MNFGIIAHKITANTTPHKMDVDTNTTAHKITTAYAYVICCTQLFGNFDKLNELSFLYDANHVINLNDFVGKPFDHIIKSLFNLIIDKKLKKDRYNDFVSKIIDEVVLHNMMLYDIMLNARSMAIISYENALSKLNNCADKNIKKNAKIKYLEFALYYVNKFAQKTEYSAKVILLLSVIIGKYKSDEDTDDIYGLGQTFLQLRENVDASNVGLYHIICSAYYAINTVDRKHHFGSDIVHSLIKKTVCATDKKISSKNSSENALDVAKYTAYFIEHNSEHLNFQQRTIENYKDAIVCYLLFACINQNVC